MTEGWLRLVFDEYKVPYQTIHPKDVAAKDFAKKFDVLVFAGASESEIETGKPPKKWEKWATPAPPEYSGGIGEKGEKLLKEMTKAGKILVFMEESCNYAINKFKMPVTNIMEENSKVICPGSYLRAEVKASPLTAGMDGQRGRFLQLHPDLRDLAAAGGRRKPLHAAGLRRSRPAALRLARRRTGIGAQVAAGRLPQGQGADHPHRPRRHPSHPQRGDVQDHVQFPARRRRGIEAKRAIVTSDAHA